MQVLRSYDLRPGRFQLCHTDGEIIADGVLSCAKAAMALAGPGDYMWVSAADYFQIYTDLTEAWAAIQQSY